MVSDSIGVWLTMHVWQIYYDWPWCVRIHIVIANGEMMIVLDNIDTWTALIYFHAYHTCILDMWPYVSAGHTHACLNILHVFVYIIKML